MDLEAISAFQRLFTSSNLHYLCLLRPSYKFIKLDCLPKGYSEKYWKIQEIELKQKNTVKSRDNLII